MHLDLLIHWNNRPGLLGDDLGLRLVTCSFVRTPLAHLAIDLAFFSPKTYITHRNDGRVIQADFCNPWQLMMDQSSEVHRLLSLAIIDTSQPIPFTKPVKQINDGQDVSKFLTSRAYTDLMTFLLQLNRSLVPSLVSSSAGQTIVKTWESDSPNIALPDSVVRLRTLIGELQALVSEAPPDPGPRRFGNVSFRKWYQLVEEGAPDRLEQYLPRLSPKFRTEAMPELITYLLGSFGSPQRLDYGSGHELNFLAFLGCVWKLGGFTTSYPVNQERAIVIGVIQPYLQLVRHLIKTYNLEPAGSHGVWGLDDHSFIPYILGSAQYGPPISERDQTPQEGSCNGAPDPGDVAKSTLVDKYRASNLYFAAIGFIHDVKSGPFWEHSPMLYDISGVKAGWGKINKV